MSNSEVNEPQNIVTAINTFAALLKMGCYITPLGHYTILVIKNEDTTSPGAKTTSFLDTTSL